MQKINKFNDMKEKQLKDLKIGIVGVGMVGGASRKYFESKGIKPFLYDKGKNLGSMDDINQADVIFICVPTPFDKNEGFDLSYVEEACGKIKGEKIIVIKSTVVPGATEKLQKKYPQHKFLFNPEFLTETTADQDMSYPDRQIVGYTKKSYNVATDLLMILPLAPFDKIMPATEAEMVKYFGNTWFAIKVIFANQIYDLCQKIGVDYSTIMESAAADKRIGRSHLEVIHKGYRGYGGKCLPKDIKALIQFADLNGIDLKLHKMAERINKKLMKDQKITDPEKFSKR
jgi:UDPglucose 6-dehydrogenase